MKDFSNDFFIKTQDLFTMYGKLIWQAIREVWKFKVTNRRMNNRLTVVRNARSLLSYIANTKIIGQIPHVRSHGSHGMDHPRCPVCLVTDLRVSGGEIIRRRPGIRLDRRISPGRVLSRFRGSLRVEPSIPPPLSSFTTLTVEGVRRFRPAVTCWTRRRQLPRHVLHACCQVTAKIYGNGREETYSGHSS